MVMLPLREVDEACYWFMRKSTKTREDSKNSSHQHEENKMPRQKKPYYDWCEFV